ncbi:hypothetical protein HXX76_001285 [Chlamydomonas incerta]|uniref:Uncharacterized protein n=1 Tax=Chlamydomonas incerta TaxID=51695 RepID=A0A835WBU2_CHLIN|nr:hypothetical protein HXX76_001285 [Chlamydomonas incerta]|eukprot:KAG2444539.1 hypothetical protein HXX76_001285 [Chlamydomonas incerta]
MWASQRVSSEIQFEPPGPCSPYVVGVNAIFLPLIPYTIFTALHDTHVHLAFILGTAFSGGIILFGLLCRATGGYRSWPFLFEILMLIVNAVLLGMSYAETHDIIKYTPFIANSVFSAFAVVSIAFRVPFTLQYVRQFVPPASAGHDAVTRAAYYTSAAWTTAFVANTLIYLVPICKGKQWQHSNALNLVFRIILPIFFALFAAIFTRIWPIKVLHMLIRSIGFDSAPRKVVVNPLAFPGGAGGMPPPMLAGGVPITMQPPVVVHAVAV